MNDLPLRTAPVNLLGFGGPDQPDRDGLHKCVHCGFCLQACPTYLETGLETESPRGRLALMRAVADGRAALTDDVVQHFDLCLLCRACEAACPSGVPYGALMEATRTQIAQRRPPPLPVRLLRRLVFEELLPHPGRMRVLAHAIRLYQRTIQPAVRATGLLQRVAPRLAQAETLLPQLTRQPRVAQPPPVAPSHQRVALLNGCVQPLVYGEVNAATVRVLKRNGCDVLAPPEQGCCGALMAHSGALPAARQAARRNIDAFLAAGVDAIVVNSAGCGAAMKGYGELLKDDPVYHEQALRVQGMVQDFSEFLAANLRDRDFGPLPWRVTLQEPCHLAHAQRIKAQPRALLAAIPQLEMVEMPAADRCCGSAGIYNLVQPEMSLRLLDRKMADFQSTGADVIVTANPGCQLQLGMGLQRSGMSARVMHIAEVLDAAYAAAGRHATPQRHRYH